ncbi:putative leucine-rich repeat receptor-like serine/threonine-protein kinase [Dorcoceras hygrometricum]|uniref:non-specific serine/threonine protein kinase n=1 Tax=Dorcoceras hygrometricum TaxID=472368 RepID=A0A2Z7CMU1_9LAMI|nr:putative leucine-rich repeat receptor-like serine/threonine-protein kinase [Dorcoceras hygrometricum]
MFFPRSIIAFFFLVGLASSATLLPADELDTLQKIGTTLGKTDWDFSVDPCGGSASWISPPAGAYENNVTCSCINNTVCHVVSIILKGQSLPGRVPPEIVRLPFLQQIDLTRNYLNGTIPPEWGSMQLVNISLLGNRISGPIPKELANISTLANLTLEYNQLTGPIPQEFGNFPRIEKILFTSNYLTGKLPETLGKLTTLKDFRIGDNNFTGSIPDFIQNWTNITKIVMQGSGLSGPIPSSISTLTQLTDLRISDLNGNGSAFPFVANMTNLKTLILRSCNIVGQLPAYLGKMTKLKVLDLSFNNLTGPIPDSFIGISNTDYIYLTGNSLSGPLPSWMLTDGDVIDLSYNNLTYENSSMNCQPRKLNLFSGSKPSTPGVVSCLRGLHCSRQYYTIHINCGGKQVVDDKGTTYDGDVNSGGPSNFFQSTSNWAFSSTGHFLDDDRPSDSYIWANNSNMVGENPQLYMDARLSPLSLTYYGFCMMNGNYTVNLHFAEIMFTSGPNYSSLGRRYFDIYIQGKLVLKDFNIEDEAGGVNKPLRKNFTAVVTDNTLEIRFFWAGKGTIGIPARGVYGPLISAISVTNDFPTPSEGSSGISGGAIAGIVIGVLSAVSLVLFILWWNICRRREDTLENEFKNVDLNTASFTLKQIKAATKNFDPANKIGEGGFGPVYTMGDGTVIAVKQLSSKSKQGNREFVNEIGMISALQNPYLVKLHGCCIEGNQLLLIYEYLENNSLARALFGPEQHQLHLDWPKRHKICIGIASGLAYLHEESRLKIVHRDIKATNILLDKNLNPKISDFGLAKLDEEENTHISTRIAGTHGYMAPEYAMRGYLTDKADVYSFGVVVLEIVSGRSNTSIRPKDECFYLLDWAHSLKQEGNIMELVDPRLGSNFDAEEVITTINIALLCTSSVAAERPSMSSVVSILEGKTRIEDFASNLNIPMDVIKPQKMGPEEEKVARFNDVRGQSISMDVPWTASSAATTDLYPVPLDSDYWEKREP